MSFVATRDEWQPLPQAPQALCDAAGSEGLALVVLPWGRAIGEALEAVHGDQTGLAGLVPARTDTRWWHEFCAPHEVRFLRGRVKFQGERSGAPFPSAVVVFGTEPAVRYWDWRSGAAPGPAQAVSFEGRA